MGWTYTSRKVNTPEHYLTAEFTGGELQPLKAVSVGSTVYMAIRRTPADGSRSYVFGMVILTENDAHGFGWKDMSEEMGPYECQCPDSIMALLSPVADMPFPGYSQAWRDRCMAQAARNRIANEVR